ncbi:MAG: AEC family transporter [Pseudomonadota bacterium]
MDTLIALFLIVLPVFLVVGAGYASVKTRTFPAAGIGPLVTFATGIAVPVLLFRAIYRLDLGQVFEPSLLISFYAAALASFAGATILARRVFKARPGESVAIGFCALFSNSVLLGLPVVERAYGSAVMQPAFAIIAIHAPFCYLVGITAMEISRRDPAGPLATVRRIADEMLHNALTIGIIAGFVFNLGGIALPEPVLAAVDLIAAAGLPVALFGLGGVLTRYRLGKGIAPAAVTAAFSVMVHPAIAWVLATQVFGLGEDFTRAAVLIAAMPTGVNGYVFAAMYDRSVQVAASTVLLATASSVLSITFWLYVLGGTGF